jgi:beta-lactamase regulating signal transducer with metallopeptidase domain
MNAIGIAVIWCVIQVTLIGLLASGLYLLLRRLRPGAAEPVVLTSLIMVVVLSFMALSPWPRWTSHRFFYSAQSSTIAKANNPLPPTDHSAQNMSHNSPLPLGEGQGVRDAGPLANYQASPGEGQGVRAAGQPTNLRSAPGDGQVVKEIKSSSVSLFWQSLGKAFSQPQDTDAAMAWGWPAVAAMLLMTFMICGLGWLMLGVMAVRRQVLRSRPVYDGKLLELVDVLRAELGCRRPVEIRQCDDLITAATVGWLRPVILLPVDSQTWTADQRHAVLAHEIAHARSQDFLALLCGQFGLTLHFYHPLMHWLMNRLRLEQELAADAAAASVSGGQRQYLTTIAELALRKQDRPLMWPARTFLPTKNTFLRRIAMLRDSKLRIDRLSPFMRIVTVGAVLLCGLLVAGLRGPGNSNSALAEDQTKLTQDESKKTFEARFPSGITVELLGVCENPSKDKPWWRPDGSLLADRPYNSVIGQVFDDQDRVIREFAVLVHNLPSEPVGTLLEFEQSGSAACGTPDLLDPYKGELHAMAVSLPNQPTVTVRFAVADGPWETVQESRGSVAIGSTNGGFIFSKPVETLSPNSDARVILISVTHEIISNDTRLVAVGTDGREHTASSTTGSGAHNFKQITAEFSKLQLKDIKTFRLQKRPYKWVEFRNVSLQLGQKTDVQVAMPDKDAPAEAHETTSTQSQVEPKGPILIYEVDPKSAPSEFTGSDMEKILNVIDKRINAGTKKIARIQLVEHSKIEIALLNSSAAEASRVVRLLERLGTLEFRILANTNDHKSLIERALKEPDKNVIKDSEGNREAWWVPIMAGRENDFSIPSIAKRERTVGDIKVSEILVVQDKYNVTGDLMQKVSVGTDQQGSPYVEFALTAQGGKQFGALTGENTPDGTTGFTRRLGIILDGKLYSAPGLHGKIQQRGIIQGSFTKQEVADLVDALNSGSLPVQLKLVRKQSSENGSEKPEAEKQQSLQPPQLRLYPTEIDPVAAGKKALEKYDTDKDGKISGAELDKAPALKAAMQTMHTNKDTGITADDIANRIKAWQATKIARIGGVVCKIIRDGKPVEGAEVKFVPEDFLGKEFKTAAGTTDKDGFATMSIPVNGPGDLPGVAPGFYNVEISKSGEEIPAKYNSQTIYGLEIAPDVRMSQAPEFDISANKAMSDKETSQYNLKK